MDVRTVFHYTFTLTHCVRKNKFCALVVKNIVFLEKIRRYTYKFTFFRGYAPCGRTHYTVFSCAVNYGIATVCNRSAQTFGGIYINFLYLLA